jgi:hypothetical protein
MSIYRRECPLCGQKVRAIKSHLAKIHNTTPHDTFGENVKIEKLLYLEKR